MKAFFSLNLAACAAPGATCAAAQKFPGSTPREFAAVIRADIERWGKLAKELGIQPQ